VGTLTLVGAGRQLTVMLGADAPTPGDLGGVLEERARDNDKPVLVWTGGKLKRLVVPVLFDGFADNIDQQPLWNTLEAMAEASVGQPAAVVASGTIPYPGRTWWIESVSVGKSETNDYGMLVRREATINLVEPNTPTQVAIYAAPAANTPKGAAKTYTVKKGETLHKIAAKLLGDASKWKQIGNLNDIRDPRKELKAGRVLRLP
jgi:hypothetical protein